MPKMKRDERGVLLFDCPGCGMLHAVYPEGCAVPERPRWNWNGSLEAPTLSPSLLVTWMKSEAMEGPDDPKVQPGRMHPDRPSTIRYVECRCHSFITDGHIQFCGDSTHALAGQTVPIPEWED